MEALFKEGVIGSLTLKNRVLMAGMETNTVGEDGMLTPKVFRFYEERAKGGVAMIMTGCFCVDKRGKTYAKQFMIDQDRLTPDLKRLAD